MRRTLDTKFRKTIETASEIIAERMINAERAFADQIVEISGCTAAEARSVTRLYLKAKLAKLDAVSGRISVVHGAYLDPRAIRNAISMIGAGA